MNSTLIKIALVLFFCFQTTGGLFAQSKYLLLQKTNTQKIKVFNEDVRLKIRTLDGDKLRGKFQIIDSNTISIKNQLIALSEIKRIRSTKAFGKYAGTSMMAGGVGTVLISPLTAIMNENGSKAVRHTALVGLGVVAVGLLIKQATPPSYHHKKWNYKIVVN